MIEVRAINNRKSEVYDFKHKFFFGESIFIIKKIELIIAITKIKSALPFIITFVLWHNKTKNIKGKTIEFSSKIVVKLFSFLQIGNMIFFQSNTIDKNITLSNPHTLIFNSVKKTGKCIVLHEDCMIGGYGADLSALITENCFEYLDAPVIRSASLNTPVPFAEDLEKNWDKISDFSEAKPFFNGGEQTGKVLEKAMKGI